MLEALRFLTVLPVPGGRRSPAAGCVRWFPMVGLVVGVLWAASYAAAEALLTPFVAAAVTLAVDGLITGGLHLDAVADVADGVGSRRPAEEAVRIMREPRIGALGAAALVLVCLVRVSVLAVGGWRAPALIVAPVAGRAAMSLIIALVPAAPGSSLASAFQPVRARDTVAALSAAAAAVLAVTLWLGLGSSLVGLGALAGALAAATAYAAWWRARFGALVGDGVGAGGMLGETLALIILAAWLGHV